MRPTPEQLELAQRSADDQWNQIYNSDSARWIRSGQAAMDASEQDAKITREIDAWMKESL
jgi:hypothetical protein